MIKDFAFVAYSVNDVPKAVAFYRDVVGLKPGQSFGDHWAEFDLGTSAFGVGNGTALGMIPGTSHSAAFEVDDLAGDRARLIASGVEVTDINEFPGCFTCFVTDPDGNRFALHQRKP
jgi:predicted enzyme related to lactoylglutathione lyase